MSIMTRWNFPGGQIVMVTRLVPGQTATVLQLPAAPQERGERQYGGSHAGQRVARM